MKLDCRIEHICTHFKFLALTTEFSPVLECDISVIAAAIHCFSTHILFDWAFLHITVITTASYIICAMSGLTIEPPATPLPASSNFVYENLANIV
jgi:hypothetical protein